MPKKQLYVLVALAVCLKLFLFVYAEAHVPDLKVQNDTYGYLEAGMSLASKGAFGQTDPDGSFTYQYYRTPGYPLFLGIFHGLFKIPLSGVIVLQIILTIFSALIVRQAAININPALGTPALIIILFDPAITVYSLMLLTESLFLLFMSILLYAMTVYLRKQEIKYLVLSMAVLTAATYVRPVSFYLSVPLALFIFWAAARKAWKKAAVHALVFLVATYSLLFVWQWRNYRHFREFQFSNIENATIRSEGLYKSYSRNKDPVSQGLPPAAYYLNVSARSLMSLFTRPASFKYFKSDILKKCGKVFSYPWIAFWLLGFLFGIRKTGNHIAFQFCLLVLSYFTVITVVGVLWGTGARFRVPLMPFIAVISSLGWRSLFPKIPEDLS